MVIIPFTARLLSITTSNFDMKREPFSVISLERIT